MDFNIRVFKHILVFSILVTTIPFAHSQSEDFNPEETNKGSMYMYWGWNRGWYSTSNITFSGTDYSFTLNNVVAKDRQSKFSLDTYFNPPKATIPQYNFRIGYFIKEQWDISIGMDHMKYVVLQNQEARISGHISNSMTRYDGNYNNEKIILKDDFLLFEHTDGLNYLNIELRHSTNIFKIGTIKIQSIEGLGLGVLIPRTNTTLLGKERNDEFHFSGYGTAAVLGLNISFLKFFFVKTLFKAGYINLPSVRTTRSKTDRANHSFYFSQLNIVFGGNFKL